MLNIKNNRECFFDDYLIDTAQTTAEFRLHQPIPRGSVIVHDEPWEGSFSNYHNFFKDGDIYRMYYLGNRKFDTDIYACYAESRDGINWIKPKLGLYEFNGSKENNIVFEHLLDSFFVIRDDNPACKPGEKYKAISMYSYKNLGGGARTCKLGLYCSPDPFHFTFKQVISDTGYYDSLNTLCWDPTISKYRCYFRGMHGEPGVCDVNYMIRDICYIESDDCLNWSDPLRLDFGEAEDIPLYTNNIMPYYRSKHQLIGFPTRYIERKVWTGCFEELGGREMRLERLQKARRFGLALTDCAFIASHDSVRFKRYDEAFLRPEAENGRNWVYGDGYLAHGMIETPSAVSGAANELSLYSKCNHWIGTPAELNRYTLRLDGFVSLHAGQEEKLALTKEFIFEGGELYTNFSTSAWGHVYFTLIDNGGVRYSSCEEFGDSVDRRVVFYDGVVAKLSGKPVRLELRLRDADVYAIRFGEKK